MTFPGNGTAKRIIAGVSVAIVVFLAGAVLANSNRITAIEVEMKSMRDMLRDGRTENREEHGEIRLAQKELRKELGDKLDAIAREVGK